MVKVELSHVDWENVMILLTEIRDSDRFAQYIDSILDTIEAAVKGQS